MKPDPTLRKAHWQGPLGTMVAAATGRGLAPCMVMVSVEWSDAPARSRTL